ncbi:hypothetical protein C1J01_15680 [Nonomuraea aridisoli]|uniref:WD40 repeat domain-containing protein n=1 Tax=Nonomuraea aridisoli TaxID=2070368 RepID=A0A2W2E2M8_9ACTN|nr:hypothetical protein C1J01_15680 [Nonomuraea aridisoli]
MLWGGRLTRRLGVLTPPDAAASRGYPGVSAPAFSPDGRVLAVARGRESVQLWDTVAHRPIGSGLPTAGDHILALALSADGPHLVRLRPARAAADVHDQPGARRRPRL